MIKLIATDMDGTFLDATGEYDRLRFKRVLRELQAHDIRFVVASGNQMHRLEALFHDVHEEISYVAENGAHIVDGGETFLARFMDRSLVEEALSYFGDNLVEYRVIVAGFNDSYILKDVDFIKQEQNRPMPMPAEKIEAFFNRLYQVKTFAEMPDDDFLKITLWVDLKDAAVIMADFNAKFKGRLTAMTSGFGAIDIIQEGLDKAWGLRQLMKQWEVSEDQVMAFGDGGNDLSMLALAKYSYAMANAPEDVKAAAAFEAPANTQGGVLSVIEAYLAEQPL